MIALTVFFLNTSEGFTTQRLQTQIAQWLEFDDVFNRSFLSHVAIASTDREIINQMSYICDDLNHSWGTESCALVSPDVFPSMSPQGPYLIWKDSFCKPFKLYDDVQEAFMLATKPRAEPEYVHLNPHRQVNLNLTRLIVKLSRICDLAEIFLHR